MFLNREAFCKAICWHIVNPYLFDLDNPLFDLLTEPVLVYIYIFQFGDELKRLLKYKANGLEIIAVNNKVLI